MDPVNHSAPYLREEHPFTRIFILRIGCLPPPAPRHHLAIAAPRRAERKEDGEYGIRSGSGCGGGEESKDR
jgi:hypothetical protein